MFDGVQWLFFDIDSTLANEERVYEHLIKLASAQTEYSCEEIAEMVLSSYKNNQNGFKETVKRLGIAKPKWDPTLETVYDDASPVLEALHSKYKIGIIANQEPGCIRRLEKMGIARFFDVIVFSAEEGISKPDVRLFNIALSRSNCKPQNAVMIGDRIDNDIAPAKKIGMHTIWIKQGYGQYWSIQSAEEIPDATVSCLAELIDILI